MLIEKENCFEIFKLCLIGAVLVGSWCHLDFHRRSDNKLITRVDFNVVI